MMNSKIRHFALISTLTLALIASFMTRVAYAEMPWDSNFDSTTEKDNGACSIVCVSVFLFERIDA